MTISQCSVCVACTNRQGPDAHEAVAGKQLSEVSAVKVVAVRAKLVARIAVKVAQIIQRDMTIVAALTTWKEPNTVTTAWQLV